MTESKEVHPPGKGQSFSNIAGTTGWGLAVGLMGLTAKVMPKGALDWTSQIDREVGDGSGGGGGHGKEELVQVESSS